jgi:tetratricopeptide (TPR) repeat protein
MDTRRVVARFEAEQQALALMDHPNIARVFDAGATPEGRPYFVMELVRGVPITEHCDRHRLTTRERLELFMQVCDGVQHAHQKAVIHRDLKPSNILVTVQDGHAMPKIIDFGVAKATQRHLTEKTVFTELGQLIGTPEYMSPEQAEMTGQNVDTRTDVYSLGVLLYELLAGALPFDPQELRKSGFDEIRRAIREEDPVKPSVKVHTLGDASDELAGCRRTDPISLVKLLRRDLDWITLKCLEKDRTRRYASPAELRADIERYLRHQPVQARPPSAAYHARKFVRRHRLGVTIAVAAMLLLCGFSVRERIHAVQVSRERDRANVEAQRAGEEAETARQVSDFLVGLFLESDPKEARGNTITVREALDRGAEKIRADLADRPVVQARLMVTMAEVYDHLGLYEDAVELFEEALVLRRRELGNDHVDVARTLRQLGSTRLSQARYAEAIELLREAITVLESAGYTDNSDYTESLVELARIHKQSAEYPEARRLLQRALALDEQLFGEQSKWVAMDLQNLGDLHRLLAEYEQAADYLTRAIAIKRDVLPPNHPSIAVSLNSLGRVLCRLQQYDRAEIALDEALEIRQSVYGERHPSTAFTIHNLGLVYLGQGRTQQAREQHQRARDIRIETYGREHPSVAASLAELARVEETLQHFAAAEGLLREALEITRRTQGGDHPEAARLLNQWGELVRRQGQTARGIAMHEEALSILTAVLAEQHPLIASTREAIDRCRREAGDTGAASPPKQRAPGAREGAGPP